MGYISVNSKGYDITMQHHKSTGIIYDPTALYIKITFYGFTIFIHIASLYFFPQPMSQRRSKVENGQAAGGGLRSISAIIIVQYEADSNMRV